MVESSTMSLSLVSSRRRSLSSRSIFAPLLPTTTALLVLAAVFVSTVEGVGVLPVSPKPSSEEGEVEQGRGTAAPKQPTRQGPLARQFLAPDEEDRRRVGGSDSTTTAETRALLHNKPPSAEGEVLPPQEQGRGTTPPCASPDDPSPLVGGSDSTAETNKTASAAKSPVLFTCTICAEKRYSAPGPQLAVGCRDKNHTNTNNAGGRAGPRGKGLVTSFCFDCVQHYLHGQIEEGKTLLTCPEPDCRGQLEMEDVQKWCTAEMSNR